MPDASPEMKYRLIYILTIGYQVAFLKNPSNTTRLA
jgi:hypothetical protein